jgi:3-hydroxyacyl-[acyl-carrier-protein] dehydratase
MDPVLLDLLASLSKKRIFKETHPDTSLVDYSQKDIKKLIPHRKPFLFLDTIDKIDLPGHKAAGTFYLNPNSHILHGHFPNNPIFPGVLQVEMIGQLGLCLSNFLLNNTVTIVDIKNPINGIATHVREANFRHSLIPTNTAFIEVFIPDVSELSSIIAGQIYNNDNRLCVTAIMEVYYPQ